MENLVIKKELVKIKEQQLFVGLLDENMKEVIYKGYERLPIKAKQIKVENENIILRNKNHLKFAVMPDKTKKIISYIGIFQTKNLKEKNYIAYVKIHCKENKNEEGLKDGGTTNTNREN